MRVEVGSRPLLLIHTRRELDVTNIAASSLFRVVKKRLRLHIFNRVKVLALHDALGLALQLLLEAVRRCSDIRSAERTVAASLIEGQELHLLVHRADGLL